MHSHDLDLIAAYADGSALDETEARALIETCGECRAEYEAQRSVLSALGSLPPLSPMTDIEKAGLHRDLWTELRNPPAMARAANPWWWRWTYAAAGLFLVVGLAGVILQLGQGDDAAETFTEVSSGLDDGQSRDYEEEPLAPQGEDGSATTSAGGSSAESGVTTTMAALEAPAPVSDSDFEALAADARRATLSQSTTSTTAAEQADRCLDDERLGGQEVLATVELDRTYLIMVPAGVEVTEETPITFVDASTCQVVHVVE